MHSPPQHCRTEGGELRVLAALRARWTGGWVYVRVSLDSEKTKTSHAGNQILIPQSRPVFPTAFLQRTKP